MSKSTETPAVDETPADEPKTDAAPSAIELLAQAGDENARRALGQPTASLDGPSSSGGFTVGEPASRDVFVDLDGKISDGKPGDDGFRGSQVMIKGAPVTAAGLAAFAAASA